MAGRFDGKVAVITGGAGGIGRAAAERFASEGARVVIVDLESSDLAGAQAAVEAAGGEAVTVAADVTNSEDVARYAQTAIDRFGQIDCFLNNAGTEGVASPITAYPEDVFDRVIAVNVKGVFLGLKHVAPLMAEGGAIVNTSSIAGLGGTPLWVAYGASKHAVVGLTRTAALEFARYGLRVNAVCPAPVDTRMMRAIELGRNAEDPDAVRAAAAAAIPLRRYGEPWEVAALVAFLCSDDAAFITGGIYPIDGGTRAS